MKVWSMFGRLHVVLRYRLTDTAIVPSSHIDVCPTEMSFVFFPEVLQAQLVEIWL